MARKSRLVREVIYLRIWTPYGAGHLYASSLNLSNVLLIKSNGFNQAYNAAAPSAISASEDSLPTWLQLHFLDGSSKSFAHTDSPGHIKAAAGVTTRYASFADRSTNMTASTCGVRGD